MLIRTFTEPFPLGTRPTSQHVRRRIHIPSTAQLNPAVSHTNVNARPDRETCAKRRGVCCDTDVCCKLSPAPTFVLTAASAVRFNVIDIFQQYQACPARTSRQSIVQFPQAGGKL